MGNETKIEWTDSTWNPIIGCSRVSEGCRNCYAEGIAGRFGAGKETVYSGLTQIVNGRAVWTGKIAETRQLLEPLKWKHPRRVFVNSMSDLFHENVSDELRDRIFAVMALSPQHTFQVLTKRPERMLEYFVTGQLARVREAFIGKAAQEIHLARTRVPVLEWSGLPMPNVWLGVSVENQEAADERIPLLLKTPAAVRFISAEPLLGPVQLLWLEGWGGADEPPLTGRVPSGDQWDDLHFIRHGASRLDWVICGGESGPHARPMHPTWARNLRDQCTAAGVPFFFKQWGEWAPTTDPRIADERGLAIEDCMSYLGKKAAGALLDGQEWKQFPASAHAG